MVEGKREHGLSPGDTHKGGMRAQAGGPKGFVAVAGLGPGVPVGALPAAVESAAWNGGHHGGCAGAGELGVLLEASLWEHT